MSLADQIAKLVNPAPAIHDPEDDINAETAAKLCEKTDEDSELITQISSLRSRNAPLLDEIDPKYAGRRVKRKDLDDFVEPDVSSNKDESSEEEDDDDDDDEAIESFKLKIQKKSLSSDRNISDDESVGLSDDDDDLQNKEEDSDESEDGDEGDVEDEAEEDDDEGSDDDMVQKFSSIDVSSEIEKGKAVEIQQELWSRLCECRIKLQKLLTVANKLPQFYAWNAFKQNSDSAYTENVNKGYKTVGSLLNGFLDLQTELLNTEPEFTSAMRGNIQGTGKNISDDEEIPSDDEEGMKNNTVVKDRILRKRKLKDEEYNEVLAKRHKSLIPYRNSVIQKWDEKTRLSTGRMTQKSFSAFDQSALKQIEQILEDKNRLIKRTQLKRTVYRVLGKPEPEDPEMDAGHESKESKRNELMKDYDPEIFDDNDFYQQLLKDIIECKSVGIDPAILNKQQEIQKVRSKMKKKVDTKASKGRKIRYDAHPKLVNFMAPVVTCEMSGTARDELFKSLFGQCSIALST